MWLWGSIAVIVGLVVVLVLVLDRRRGAQSESRGDNMPGTTRRGKRYENEHNPYGGGGGMSDGGGGGMSDGGVL